MVTAGVPDKHIAGRRGVGEIEKAVVVAAVATVEVRDGSGEASEAPEEQPRAVVGEAEEAVSAIEARSRSHRTTTSVPLRSTGSTETRKLNPSAASSRTIW